jgi:hypothetical protein
MAAFCIGSTERMPVAVSIPDDVVAEAEALAKRLKAREARSSAGRSENLLGTTLRIVSPS